MVFYALLSIPMAVAWMAVTGQYGLDSFVIGYFVSFVLLFFVPPAQRPVNLARVPGRVINGLIYVVILLRDILLSSIDVARRVLSPDMRLKPGIIRVPTGDPQERESIAALSAHGITITPGNLVVEFDDTRAMFVHCLDVEQSDQRAEADQTRRRVLFERILQEEG